MNGIINKENISKLVVETLLYKYEDDIEMLSFFSKVEDVDDINDILCDDVCINNTLIELDDNDYEVLVSVLGSLSDDEFAKIQREIEDGLEMDDVNGEILRGYYSDLL